MTRQEKCRQWAAKLAETKRAIQTFPAFFPSYVVLELRFGEPSCISRQRRNTKVRGTGFRYFSLTVPEDWLETVYARGAAVVGRCFVLQLREVPAPTGCEWAAHAVVLEHGDAWKLVRHDCGIVSFAGNLYSHMSPDLAYLHARQELTAALTGCDESEVANEWSEHPWEEQP